MQYFQAFVVSFLQTLTQSLKNWLQLLEPFFWFEGFTGEKSVFVNDTVITSEDIYFWLFKQS